MKKIAVIFMIVLVLFSLCGCNGYRHSSFMLVEAIKNDDIEEVERLLKSGVDPNRKVSSTLFGAILGVRIEPIYKAAAGGSYESFKLCMEYGGNPNYTWRNRYLMDIIFGDTVTRDEYKKALLLLEYNPDLSKITDMFWYISSDYSNQEEFNAACILYDAYVASGAEIEFNQDAFKWIAQSGNIYILEKMLPHLNDKAAAVNGSLPLLAMYYHSKNDFMKEKICETIDFLVVNGGDVLHKDEKGKTAIDYAKKHNEMNLVKLLESYVDNN